MTARHHRGLLAASQLLLRKTGQRGRLSNALVRRSIPTTYYALFHFLIEEAGIHILGADAASLRRRRALARSFTHTGVRVTLSKVIGGMVDRSVADLFRPTGMAASGCPSPPFAREIARTFIDAQAKREDADYDLNASLVEGDADLLLSRVRQAIVGWDHADTRTDRDFKQALCALFLLKGQIR